MNEEEFGMLKDGIAEVAKAVEGIGTVLKDFFRAYAKAEAETPNTKGGSLLVAAVWNKYLNPKKEDAPQGDVA